MSIEVGALHLALTAPGAVEVDRALANVDRSARTTAVGMGTTTDAMKKFATQTMVSGGAMGTLTGALSSMIASGGLTLAVVAGTTAISAAYEFLTEKTRKAKEEQDKLTKSLEDWYKAKRKGVGEDRAREVAAERKKLRALEQELAVAELMAAPRVGGAGQQGGSGVAVAEDKKRVEALRLQVSEIRAAIEAGSADVIRARTSATVDEIANEIVSLKALEKHGTLRVEQRKRLAALEQNAAQMMAAYNDPNVRMEGITGAERLDMVVQLSAALHKGDVAVKASKDTTDALIASLVTLAAQQQTTSKDLAVAVSLYDAEATVLKASATSIDRRALAIKRMRELEKAGVVTAGPLIDMRQGALQIDGTKPKGVPPEFAPEERLADFRDAYIAFQQEALGLISSSQLGAILGGAMSDQIGDAFESSWISRAQALATQFATFTTNIFSTAIDAIGASLSGGWDGFRSVMLGGLGSILQEMGKSLMIYGAGMLKLLPALKNPFTSGPAAIAVGALIFGAGAALSSIAGGSGSASGSIGGGSGSLGIGGASSPQVYTIGGGRMNSGFSNASSAPQAMTTNVTVIGPNDPVAQRAIVSLIENAARRGLNPSNGMRT